MDITREHTTSHEHKGDSYELWIKAVNSVVFLCWALFVFVLITLEKARPMFESFVDRTMDFRLKYYWDFSLIRTAALELFIILVASVLSLCIYAVIKEKRETGVYIKNIIFMLILSTSGIVTLYLNFYR